MLPCFPPSYKRKLFQRGDCGDYTDPFTMTNAYSNTGINESELIQLKELDVSERQRSQSLIEDKVQYLVRESSSNNLNIHINDIDLSIIMEEDLDSSEDMSKYPLDDILEVDELRETTTDDVLNSSDDSDDEID